MKIIGFIYRDEKDEMVLKGDSCLLNGRKPLFMPEWTKELGVTECIILRVSRLGKEIAPKFADRYYDAVAPGADFIAMDLAREAEQAGRPWTQALAFDYSLAIGEFVEPSVFFARKGHDYLSGQYSDYVLTPEEAIAKASKVMTIRQGDLIYIQKRQAPRPVAKEEIIRVEIDGEEKLYCKIK
jgi:2-keto-4-pentenoate hydratase/2-oxohepta-3-ene-1,7-dioic acid hydratase in catechol pathway